MPSLRPLLFNVARSLFEFTSSSSSLLFRRLFCSATSTSAASLRHAAFAVALWARAALPARFYSRRQLKGNFQIEISLNAREHMLWLEAARVIYSFFLRLEGSGVGRQASRGRVLGHGINIILFYAYRHKVNERAYGLAYLDTSYWISLQSVAIIDRHTQTCLCLFGCYENFANFLTLPKITAFSCGMSVSQWLVLFI